MARCVTISASLISALALVACGESSTDGAERNAPSVSSFPSADGRTLEEVLTEGEVSSSGPVVSPTAMLFERGENRYGFGVFEAGGEQITDADVALYIAHGPKGQAQGPFPARVEDLGVEGPFQSRTTAQDPDSAKVAYMTELNFDRLGEWRIIALMRSGNGYQGSRLPSAVVENEDGVPGPGDPALVVHTPTADDVSDLSQIETRDPPDTMHQHDLADVLGEQPVVLVFATPALCQSRTCGPVVDIAEQVKADYGDQAAFIHVEIYEDNVVDKGVRPQVKAYGLPTEPWLFVIDRDGTVRTAIEGAFSARDLESALQDVTG